MRSLPFLNILFYFGEFQTCKKCREISMINPHVIGVLRLFKMEWQRLDLASDLKQLKQFQDIVYQAMKDSDHWERREEWGEPDAPTLSGQKFQAWQQRGEPREHHCGSVLQGPNAQWKHTHHSEMFLLCGWAEMFLFRGKQIRSKFLSWVMGDEALHPIDKDQKWSSPSATHSVQA